LPAARARLPLWCPLRGWPIVLGRSTAIS